MKVLTTEQIRQADEFTIAREPLLSIDLMERAASGLLAFLEKSNPAYRKILIFAGWGNNGGDGIALARMFANAGRNVELFLFAGKKWSPDAAANIDRLPERSNLRITYLEPDVQLPGITPDDLVLDALFGSGLNREPEGFVAEVIDYLNNCGVPIISVDIPSGLFGEDNRLNSGKQVVRATQTLTFQFPKLSFFFPENRKFTGDWTVIPIGLHPDFIDEVETPWNFISIEDASSWLQKRSKFSHKGTYGHSLLLAGSTGKAGAAVLSARACVRSGSGLTTLCIPSANNVIIQTAVPEVMTIPDPDPDHLTAVPELKPFNAIGAGPGLGTHPETWHALEQLLSRVTMPLVLDADALNLLSQNPGSLLQLPKNSILTPHPGEYNRLFGEDPDSLTRLLRMKEMARMYGINIVLKGAFTAIAGTDGSIWFNTTGNPGMATGGSGDVLTGLITGLVAQGYEPFTAARLGVFIHGLAGDLAAESTGQESLTAGDLISSMGHAFLRIHNFSK